MNRNTKLMLKTLFVFAVIIVLLTIVEYRAEGSTIRSIWDAIWYSLITLTTVGYGDKAPVTPVGRILGIMLALCSVGLLSTLVGIVLHLLRGQLLPRLKLRGCSNRKWYVFNCSGNEAQTLADELAKEEACMLVFPGEDEHGNRIDRNRVYFDGNVQELIKVRGNTDGMTLILMKEDPWQTVMHLLEDVYTFEDALLAGCMLSNPVSAEASFNDQNMESSILLASMPYSSINDNDVKIEDADLKAKYNENKEKFKQPVETRNIKYVSLQVVPSDADRQALMKTMQEAQQNLVNGLAASDVIRKSQSQVPYTGMAVTRAALPNDIAARVDSMAVGQTSAPFETRSDNTMNVVKLLAKTQMPDSVEYRMIQVGGATIDAARATADSIYQALKGGAVFDSIASKYGQPGTKQWMTSAMYQNAPVIDADSKAYITAINSLAVNEIKNLELSQGNIILQVTARKAMVDKYDVVIVKHTIDFSKQTYSDAYNKFSQFVSSSKTVESLEQNAPKFGFQVLEREHISNNEHNVVGIRATREAMKWIFDAKKNEISPLYECGNNDRLLVVALTKINEVGYADWESVKDELKREVMSDKKFDMLSKKLESAKSIADAQAQGARVDTVPLITFSAPVYVQATSGREPMLNGAVASTKQGEFSKKVVKGNEGAYVFQVLTQKMREGNKFDDKTEEQQLKQQALQAAGNFMQELYENAKVVDNRYLFF